MPVLPGKRTAVSAAISLAFTYLYFLEYLRPLRWVSIPFDLPLFHYPLMDYAFTALRSGRFPLWDPTIYAGMPFAANPQTALFYPPTWLLFLANANREHLSFWSLQEFTLLHVWLASVLCYWWLSGRVSRAAAVFGAAIYAYGGYTMLQLQHFGVIAGLAWMPLAFRGIDEAAEQNRLAPLWKTAAASALCFLAGYIPFWFTFGVCLAVYGICRRGSLRIAAGTIAALILSLLISMVQLLPTLDLSGMREAENRYGTGIREPSFYLSYVIPNLFDFGMEVPTVTNLGREYLYLGAPAIAGLLFLLFQRRHTTGTRSGSAPLAGTLAVSAVILTNPLNLVETLVSSSALLSSVCRDWSFLGGIPLPLAGLAAIGLDRLWASRTKPWPGWTAFTFAAVVLVWSLLGLNLWIRGGEAMASGWASAIDSSVQLALFAAGAVMLRSHGGTARTILLGALILSTAIDYKIHGTSKRFNATRRVDVWTRGRFEHVDPAVYETMRSSRPGRLALDRTGPFPQVLRHAGLETPQGFDPFLTAQYKSLIENLGVRFYTNWEFLLNPGDSEALRVLGVRYLVTALPGPLYKEVSEHPEFRLIEPADRFYKVFEYRNASPPFGWVDGGWEGLQAIEWEPEKRVLACSPSQIPRTLYLSEQWAPGWTARVDGTAVPVQRWRGSLQSVAVPPGAREIEFVYRARRVVWGAVISLLSAGALAGAMLLGRRRPH